jgi:hypothetical protein
MHDKLLITFRFALIFTVLFVGCFNSNALHAQDDDGDLVPGDSNDYVVLSDLVSGEVPVVTVGDKVFSVFSYSNAGDMPAAANINVFGFQDADDHFGLAFHGAFLDLPGDPNGSSALLNFDVSVSDEGQQLRRVISDAHLYMSGPGIPDNSEISVDESFLNTSETLRVFKSSLGNDPVDYLSDWIDFSETSTSRQVSALISAITGQGEIQPARTSAIELTFSQTVVPEPSTALLLICAGVMAGAGRPRNRA